LSALRGLPAVLLVMTFPIGVSISAEHPRARVELVTETLHGVTVADPYRWMENLKSPELERWLTAEEAFSRGVLDKLPLREQLVRRIDQLAAAVPSVKGVQAVNGRLFYIRADATSQVNQLLVRDATGERRLADPTVFATRPGTRYSVTEFFPSPDGQHVAFTIAPNGDTRQTVLHIVETKSGRVLPDVIDRTELPFVSWLPSGRGFFYTRLQEVTANAAPGEQYKRAAVFLHELEATPATDKPVFGWGTTGSKLHENDIPYVAPTPSASYLLGVARQAVANECAIYVAPMPSSFGEVPKWRLLVSPTDDVTAFGVRGDDIYLLSHHEAPRYKVLRVKVTAADLSKAATVVPQTRNVLRDLVVAKDAAYVSQSNGLGSDLIRVNPGGRLETVSLPFLGSIRELTGNADTSGALFTLESWTRPRHWFRVDSTAPLSVRDTGLLPPAEFDASVYEVRAKWVTSKDGTQVPLSIICRKGIKLDGSHLVLLLAYGAFGNSADPVFRAYRLVWLERGGIIAVVHARGGGDLGEAWHRAGMRTEKQHTIDDVVAGASYLIRERYTAPSRLAAWAESAGGIAVGGAMVQRPDLFGAVVLNAPVLDAVRNVVAHPENIPEYGSLDNADEFRTLLQVSPYHHIGDGVSYPATLVCIGTNDARVAIWQAMKFVARLQAASTSGKPVLLRVNRQSGHGGAAVGEVNARTADQFAFMFETLGSRAP